jgi:hypothetical protein
VTDPRLYHTITVELCTAAGLFAALSIIIKLISDGYLKYLGGKSGKMDRFARFASGLAEPTAYAMGFGNVIFTFISMYTGMNAWPFDALIGSEAVHNKMMLTVFSQITFFTFIVVRTKFGKELWNNRMLAGIYSSLALLGGAFIVLQNSVAGHLAGKGSITDFITKPLNIELTSEFALPPVVSIGIIAIVCVAVVLTIHWARKRKASNIEEDTS